MKTSKLVLALGTLTIGFASSFVLVGCGDDTSTPASDSGTGGDVVPPGDDSGGGGGEGGTDGGIDAAKPLGPIDRMGRAAINTVLIDKNLKDPWNHEDTYGVPAKTDYDTTMDQHLMALDMFDGNADYGTTTPHRLREPLKLDVLIVNTGGLPPSSAASAQANTQYLAVDGLVLFGAASPKAGGRWLTDDVVDISLGLLVCGPIKSQAYATCPVSDGVSSATKPPTFTFPYLATPN